MKDDWKDMTDEEFEAYRIERTSERIDPIRVEIPKIISEIPDYDFTFVDRPSSLTPKQRRQLERFTRKQNKIKKVTKEQIMEVVLKKIWQFLRDVLLQWIYPFAIYKKDENDRPIVNPATGKFEINWLATFLARALSLIVATWGTLEFLGMSVAEWVARITQAFGL